MNRTSTTADPSKRTETTLWASSSNVDNAGDAGKHALIVKPARKFCVKALALKRAPTYVSLKLVIVEFAFISTS